MKIRLEIGIRGERDEFSNTFTRDFLEKNGLISLGVKYFQNKEAILWAAQTKYGLLISEDYRDVLTYLGHGIWDLKPYKAAKSEDDDNKNIDNKPSEENKEIVNKQNIPSQNRENPLLWILDKIIKFIVKLFRRKK